MRIFPGLIPIYREPIDSLPLPPTLPPFFHAGIALQNFFIPPWSPIRSHLPLAKPLHLSSVLFFLFLLNRSPANRNNIVDRERYKSMLSR